MSLSGPYLFTFYSSSITSCQPVIRCKRAFQALINISLEELCEIADSLIAPVRMGVSRPTAPFTLAMANVEAIQGSEEIFNTDPLPPRTSSADTESRSVAYMSQERLSATQQASHPPNNRGDDEMMPADVEEVGYTFGHGLLTSLSRSIAKISQE